MLNEERIKLMTRMASYEEHEGRENMAIGNYFRSDYIGLQVMKAVISATLTFAIVLGVIVFYHFETVMKEATSCLCYFYRDLYADLLSRIFLPF